MRICHCILAGTKNCNFCHNNPDRTYSYTTTSYATDTINSDFKYNKKNPFIINIENINIKNSG